MGSQVPHRRVEVVYQLSRRSQLEHPHMIQVQHPSDQEGPYLRDVKDQLTAVRGKSMPDSFSWSYKRNYRSTFIWCDLLDNDVILPLRGSGEYVLKALELFDGASQDQADSIHEEFQPVSRSLDSTSIKPQGTDPSLKSSRASTQLDQLRMKNDVSLAISKSSQHIKDATLSSDDSDMDLNQLIMDSLSHFKTAPEACSLDHSDVSSCGTYQSDEMVENKTHSERTTRAKEARPAAMQCGISSQTDYFCTSNVDQSTKQMEVSMDITEMPVEPTTPTNRGEISTFQFSPSREGSATRRRWKKGADKSPIFVTTSSSRSSVSEDYSDPVQEEICMPCGVCFPGEDPVSYLLKKAFRVGGLRPRLCGNIDVVEPRPMYGMDQSTSDPRLAQQKHGCKYKRPVNEPTLEKPVKEVKEARSPLEKLKKGSRILTSEKREKEVKTLSQFLETKESRSLSNMVDKDSSKNTAEILREKPGNSRAATIDGQDFGCKEIGVVQEAVLQTPNGEFKTRPDMTGNMEVKLDVKRCSNVVRHNLKPAEKSPVVLKPTAVRAIHVATVAKSEEKLEDYHKEQKTSVRPLATAEVENHIGSDGSILELERPRRPNDVYDESAQLPSQGLQNNTEDSHVQPTRDCSVHEFSVSHSGNKQGVKVTSCEAKNPAAAVASAVTDGPGASDSTAWGPKEQTVLRDFKSRDERPLTAGLTVLDWERTLQEAVIQSQPPVHLVLHECLQCGRTFKLDSLKVHMRGCHFINKEKRPVSLRNRVSTSELIDVPEVPQYVNEGVFFDYRISVMNGKEKNVARAKTDL